MVLLASRPFNEVCPLGRETFMVPIVWEDGWPRVASQSGLVENEFPLPKLSGTADVPVWNDTNSCDHFNGKLPLHWLTLRMPVDAQALSLSARPGALRLFTKAATMRGVEHPAFAGRRIQHKDWSFMAALEFNPQQSCESAGIILLQSEDFQYRLELSAASATPSSTAETKLCLRLIRAAGKEDEIIANVNWNEAASGGPLILAAQCEEMKLSFSYGKDQYSLKLLANGLDARILSTEYAAGFTGLIAGVYATGNGTNTGNYADLLWSEYKGLV
jgi:alpha-N-arabinofuranosidase